MNHEQTNARRFLDAFNTIEQLLRRQSGAADSVGFAQLVGESKALMRKQKDELLQLAKLRNAIVHNPYDERLEPVADPRTRSVEFLEQQRDVIERPPLVLAGLRLTKPMVLSLSDDISRFLALVQPPGDFSQAPVRTADGLALITTNAVARWISTHYEQTEGGGVVPEADLGEVLRFAESGDRIELKPERLKVVEALRIFAGESGEAPAAIVITASGRPTETPLGLCVRADVPAMYSLLGF